MFVDADRPVRVGARFCAEIVLSDGRHVYIPEAEVAYNRDRPHGAGFGVRFLEVPAEARRLLGEEVARLGREPEVEEVEEPTFASFDETEIELSVPPLAVEMSSEAPDASTPASAALVDTTPIGRSGLGGRPGARRATGPWERVRHEVRAMAAQLPSLWLVLAGLGAALLVAAFGLVIWAEISEAPRVVSRPLDDAPAAAGLSSATHQRLTGAKVEEELPPLVPLEPPTMLEAPAAAVDAAPEATSPGAKPAPGDVRPAAPSSAAARDTASTPAPEASGGTPGADRMPPGAAAIARVRLPPGAEVLRSSRLREPARYVVDVRGLTLEPTETDVDGSRIERVRFGRHDGFGRLVFDLTGSTGRLRHVQAGPDLRLVELD